jgi:hypothetical protein
VLNREGPYGLDAVQIQEHLLAQDKVLNAVVAKLEARVS